jgi:hypothetical protein
MSAYTVLRRIRLGSAHKATGKTRHYLGAQELPTPGELWIVAYPDDVGYYLLYLDGDGKELTDTYHDTLDRALQQAEWEFQVSPHEWEVVK